MLEYSSTIIPRFSTSNLNKLNCIQNLCLKIIYKKSKFYSNRELSKICDVESLETRLDKLNINYINNSLMNNNELIHDLYDEFIRYSTSRELKYSTLFCKYKHLIIKK